MFWTLHRPSMDHFSRDRSRRVTRSKARFDTVPTLGHSWWARSRWVRRSNTRLKFVDRDFDRHHAFVSTHCVPIWANCHWERRRFTMLYVIPLPHPFPPYSWQAFHCVLRCTTLYNHVITAYWKVHFSGNSFIVHYTVQHCRTMSSLHIEMYTLAATLSLCSTLYNAVQQHQHCILKCTL